MKRTPFCLCLGLLMSFLSLTCARAAGARAVVESLRVEERDWPQGRTLVEAELRASGYEIRSREAVRVDEGGVIEQLARASDEENLRARIVVLKRANIGVAVVWLSNTGGIYRLTTQDLDESPSARNILSLRVAELVSLGTTVETSTLREPRETALLPDRASGAPPASPGSDSTGTGSPRGEGSVDTRESSWRVSVGIGAHWVRGLNQPGVAVSGFVSHRLVGPLALELDLGTDLVKAREGFEAGRVRLGEQRVALGPLFRGRVSRLVWGSGGVRLGASFLSIDSQTYDEEQGQGQQQRQRYVVFSPSAHVAGGLSFGRLSVFLAGEMGWFVPSLRLVQEATELTRLGRLNVDLMGGMAWDF